VQRLLRVGDAARGSGPLRLELPHGGLHAAGKARPLEDGNGLPQRPAQVHRRLLVGS
jgi:hypothetical protein